MELCFMKSILGIGNALTDVVIMLNDDKLLDLYHLPKGSMQHVGQETVEAILRKFKAKDIQIIAGGSAANTIAGTAMLGMHSSFVGKVGDDDMGSLFKASQIQEGINSILLKGRYASGISLVFITPPNFERTFAVYPGAALELVSDDLTRDMFNGYDYLHIEGYLFQNHDLVLRAVKMAKSEGMIISLDMASYNIVESNNNFLHSIVKDYVNIVFANEAEAETFAGCSPREALDILASMCDVAVVKIGKDGSMIKSGKEYSFIRAKPAVTLDETGAGDLYAAGFLFAHSRGLSLDYCGEVGSIVAAAVVEVIGTKIDMLRRELVKHKIRELTGLTFI